MLGKRLSKKGIEIGYAYIIMIVLGVIGFLIIYAILKGGFGAGSSKLLSIFNQTPIE
ncbi:MAG: hypothetical protein ACP5JY_03170 [Candidatus Nanoarchaeia archaeon]